MKSSFSMTSTITGRIWRLFALTTIFLLLFMAALYWNLSRVSESTEYSHQTELIVNELHDLGEDLLNTETGQRGYLLTRDDKYLEPYLMGKEDAQQRINRLRTLIVEPDIRVDLERMVIVATAKLEELEQTIILIKKGQREAAMSIVLAGSGKRFMDEFRQMCNSISNLEQQHLAERRNNLLIEFRYLLLLVLIGGTLAIMMLLLFTRQTVKRLDKPISSLLHGIYTMSRDQFDVQIPILSNDEIGRISLAFNEMTEHIQSGRRVLEATMKELKRSNMELDTFAYVASHDLKAPLRGIRSLTQWIEIDVEKTAGEETMGNLRLLKNRVDRLDNLLDSLLTYSRIGRKTSLVEQVNLGQLVAEIDGYLAPAPGFVIACQGDMPTISTPKAPLEQVLRNLVSNAIKHHDLGSGNVIVSAKDMGEMVEFRVEDDGPGIPMEFHERIFQMFQTLKPRDQVEGSGMGLAIVKKTIESFGGNIRVESLPSGRGVAFVFSWPKAV